MVSSLVTFAQTGPGGVGADDGSSSLKLWYCSDFGVSTTGTSVDSWTNRAGETNHNLTATGSQRPVVVGGALNGFDEVSFDGNDYLETTGSLTTSNFVVDEASSFLVCERNAITSSWLYATSPHQTDRFSCHLSWSNGRVYFDIGSCCGSQARLDVGGLSNLNTYSYWSYDALNSSGKQLYRNGTLLQNRTNTQSYNSHASHTFRIGESYNGNVTEIIIFRQKVNTAQRLIIENYLSAKYDLTPTSNNIYDEDDAVSGNFDFDVAGIGRIDASNLHNDAQGTGIIRILNPSGLDDNEFLIWGHNNGLGQASNMSDIPTGIFARFDRVWRVSERNTTNTASVDVGNIDMRVDLSNFSPITALHLRLLVDTDNDGIFSDETPISGAADLGGGIYEFTGISAIADNIRFTVATANALTPLPVELVRFEAKVIDDSFVELVWETYSEIDNDMFTVERSQNGLEWEEVGRVEGAGTTSKPMNYTFVDKLPHPLLSYYRLKQTDFDGSVTYSDVESVYLKHHIKSVVYPNPNNGKVTIVELGLDLSDLEVFSSTGQKVTDQITVNVIDAETCELELVGIPSGVYFLKTKGKTYRMIKD